MTSDENELVVAFAGELDDTGITNREELLEEIIDVYGQPMISINGVYATGDGDFTIEPGDECITVSGIQHGVSISATCGEPCCDQSVLADLTGNIQALNSKASRIDSFLKSTAAAVNALSNELAYLKMTANQECQRLI